MSALSSDLRWLVLDLNSYFASCEQQLNPALRGRPVAVVPMLAETTCVIAASYPAKAFGIKTGTMVREARRLCPDIRFVQARPREYVALHKKILTAIEDCIPIEDVMSIDEVACRLDTCQRDPARATILAHQLKTAIREKVGICLTSSVGIAANKFLAKLASNLQKPDGLTLLPTSVLPDAIRHLRLEDIPGIGVNMGARLRTHGLNDIDALWQADGQYLRRVWGGIQGLRFHELLHGVDLSEPAHQRRSLGHQHVLPPTSRNREKATPILRQLLSKAAERLRRENLYCRRTRIDIKADHGGGYYADERAMHETQDTRVLLNAVMEMWGASPIARPLRIGVTLYDLTAQHQLSLFEKPLDAGLSRAVDTLNTRYGRGTVSFGPSVDLVTKIAFQRVPDLREY